MATEEHLVEAAEACVRREQEGAIARIQDALSGAGQDDCEDCGEPIGAKRREAMPSATRCIRCQSKFEGSFRGY